MSFLFYFKDTIKTFGAFDVEAVWFLAYLLSDGAEEVYKVYTDNRMRTEVHVFHGTWPVVIHALVRGVLSKNAVQEEYYKVAWALKKLKDEALKLETLFSKTTGQFSRECLATKKGFLLSF